MHTDSIKHHKTETDERGNFREYTVYKKGNLYIFECLDWVMTENDSSRGKQKAYEEFDNVEDAVQKYEEYLEVWELKE